MIDKATTTITIPKDMHHRIILPAQVWHLLRLAPGDSLQIDIMVVQRVQDAAEK